MASFFGSIAFAQRLSLPETFLFKSPGVICIRIRTVGQSPDPPRLWRALMHFERPAERVKHWRAVTFTRLSDHLGTFRKFPNL